MKPLRVLLATPDDKIDLGVAKLTIDRMIDPRIDAAATLRQVDALAAAIKARFPPNATPDTKLELLVTSLQQSGPWNDNRPFSYDLNDPFGKDLRNKLLSTYLATRKGNCVSMPELVVIVGQRLGLDITLASAPEHLLAKYRNDHGDWINIEATSFGTKTDAGYQHDLDISPKAMTSGIYLRPLTRRESVAAMMDTLMEFYKTQGRLDSIVAVANLALQTDPKDVEAMLQKGSAYFHLIKQKYMAKYPSPSAIPALQRQDYEALSRENTYWFDKAEALGWMQPTAAEDAHYLQTVQRVKAGQQGEQP
ncbi:MAG TPA: transglutaminase family protein [Rhodanobacteraceae bacterium]|nr:transglutaminase family protein [Rhodanobacteraceae bacterium]